MRRVHIVIADTRHSLLRVQGRLRLVISLYPLLLLLLLFQVRSKSDSPCTLRVPPLFIVYHCIFIPLIIPILALRSMANPAASKGAIAS